jgi:hypothetical protein
LALSFSALERFRREVRRFGQRQEELDMATTNVLSFAG